MYEPQNTDPTDEFTLLKVIADIREKTGIGDKVMLEDLADVLSFLVEGGSTPETWELIRRMNFPIKKV